MTRQEVLAAAIEVLNEALQADPVATAALLNNRVPCNDALADHATITVAYAPVEASGNLVGMLGIVNGIVMRLCGAATRVASKEDDKGNLVAFVLTNDENADSGVSID